MTTQDLVSTADEGVAEQTSTRLSGNHPPKYSIDPLDLIPVNSAPSEYPHLFNAKQWHWLLRQRERNGLSYAIVVMGERRLFLSRKRFSEWLASRSEP